MNQSNEIILDSGNWKRLLYIYSDRVSNGDACSVILKVWKELNNKEVEYVIICSNTNHDDNSKYFTINLYDANDRLLNIQVIKRFNEDFREFLKEVLLDDNGDFKEDIKEMTYATSAIDTTYNNNVTTWSTSDCADAVLMANDNYLENRIENLIDNFIKVEDAIDVINGNLSTKVDIWDYEKLYTKVNELSDKINQIEYITHEEKKKESKIMELNMKSLGIDFGTCENFYGSVGMSMYGMAIKNKNGEWVSYNKDTGEIVNVDLFNLENGGKYLLRMPVAKEEIAVGDVILHNRVPMFVEELVKAEDEIKSLKALDPYAGELKEIILTKNMFNFEFAIKIVSLFDGMGAMGKPSKKNPFGNMLPMMMLLDGKEGNKDLLPLMMMMGQGGKGFEANPMMMMLMLKGDKEIDPMVLMMMMNMNK